MGTYEKVCSIIAEQLGIKTEAVSKESDVINDLGADSIDIVQLLMAMENEFGVTVSEDDADKLKTVGDIVSLIDSKNQIISNRSPVKFRGRFFYVLQLTRCPKQRDRKRRRFYS